MSVQSLAGWSLVLACAGMLHLSKFGVQNWAVMTWLLAFHVD